MLFLWVIVFLVLLVLWALIWQRQPRLAFGVFIGLGFAWVAARLLRPYFTGSEEIPVWLPPLPVATVAVVLLVFGILVWIRGDRQSEETREEHPPQSTHH